MSRAPRDIFIHPAAEEDIRETVLWIADDSAASARRFPDAVADISRQLAEFCRLGRKIPNDKRELRVIRVPGFRHHLVVYEVTARRLVLLRIVHGARSFPRVSIPSSRVRRGR